MPDLNMANLGQFLPLVLIFVVFYFLLIRPQQKKVSSHKQMIEAVRRGDTVVTGGGVIGKVIKVIDETTVQVEIAEGVRVRLVKSTLADVRNKGEAVATTGTKDGAESGAGGEVKKGGLLSRFLK